MSFFHEQIWRRLPRGARRSLLMRASAIAAPRPGNNAPALPIIVAGALRTASGLGESARLCLDALRAQNIPAQGLDISRGLMQSVDLPDQGYAAAESLDGPGTIILHVNAPLVPLAMWRIGSRAVRDKHIVGYWAWELPEVAADWREGVPFVHEIWVPSSFTARAIEPIAGLRPVRIVPHPVAVRIPQAAAKREARGQAGHRFTVLTIFNMGSSLVRKNPFAAIAAFREAFGDDPSAKLIVKASNMSLYPEGAEAIRQSARGANIELIERTMGVDDLHELYRQSDALVSMHRSEGFGLTIAEAMAFGLPAVATDWSGNEDFLSSDTGIPVPFRLVPASDPQATYEHSEMNWADPDVASAAAALRRLRSEQGLAARLGVNAAQFVADYFGAKRYAGHVEAMLRRSREDSTIRV